MRFSVTTSPSGAPPRLSLRRLLNTALWALRLAWSAHPASLLGMIATTVVISLTPAALTLTVRALVNELLAILSSGTGGAGALTPWLALGLVIAFTESFAKAAHAYFGRRIYGEVEVRSLSDTLAHAARLDLAFFQSLREQDRVVQAHALAAQHVSLFTGNLLSLSSNAIQILSLLGVLIAIEPAVSLALAPIASFQLLYRWWLGRMRYEMEYDRTTERRWIRYFLSRMTDHAWIPEVKLLDLGPVLVKKLRGLLVEFRDQDHGIALRDFWGSLVFMALSAAALYGALARIASRVIGGVLTAGDVAIYSGATLRLRNAIQSATALLGDIRERLLHIASLIEFLRVGPQITGTGSPPRNVGSVEFDNVSFTYPNADSPALRNVSFRIQRGETVALVGENGAGKTTLALLLARLYDPTEGRVLIDGSDLRSISPIKWRRCIGFVFQTFGRYEATAAENVAYGDWQCLLRDRALIEESARRAQVHEMIEAMPQGYDTQLGLHFGKHTLSGGQWQRLAVARAFARQTATLLILDEPTSNVDARAEYELFCRFQELAAGRTTVLISHRFSTISMADRIMVLDGGRLVEQGSHQDLLALGGHYASLYNLHARQLTGGNT
jgi:ATP-binding cassette subfamily B protein